MVRKAEPVILPAFIEMADSHPKTYKAFAFLEKGGPLKPITLDWKDPAPGEVVVKVLACGVCARYAVQLNARVSS